jgi:hypothetical protein
MTAAVAVSAPDLFSFHPSIAPLPPPPADADGSDFEFRIPAAAAALSAADELFSGGKLVPLLQDYQPPSRTLWLMYPQDRYRLPKVRQFVEHALRAWGK